MIPATLLLQTQEPTPPKPVAGIVKAFAIYIHPECLPQERAGTVYVARQLNDDGSTVTVVRTATQNANPTMQNLGRGEAKVFRDAQGKATRIESRLETVPPRGHAAINVWTVGKWEVDPEKKEGPLVGSIENSWASWPRTTLTERSFYVDPLEAIAFDPSAERGAAWLTPPSAPGTRKGRLIFPTAVRYRVLPSRMRVLQLQGRTEACRVCPIEREWLGTPSRPPFAHAGLIAYRLDGTLAVFAPNYDMENYASGAKLHGSYGKSGPNIDTSGYGPNDGYYVPIPAPANARRELLGF